MWQSAKRGPPQEPAWVRDPKSARLVKLTGKHPRDAAAEEEAQDDEMHARGDVDPSYVALISVEGPPFYDSVTGKLLDTELVLKGMMKEHESLESFGTYAWILEEEVKKKGYVVVSARWVLGERDDGARVKARVVAQQLRRDASGDDVYAAAPTSAAARLLLIMAQRRKWPVALGDVSTAFLHATLPTDGDPVITRPPPDLQKEGSLWRLKRALYGLRSSPRLFQEHFAEC